MRNRARVALATAVAVAATVSGCNSPAADDLIDDLSHPDRQVRLQASYDLVLLGAVEPLMERAGESDTLRFICAQILGRIGDARAVPLLRQLAGDSDEHVRAEAVVALGKMGDVGVRTSLEVALLGDRSQTVRSTAAEGLGNLRDTLAVGPLVRALGDSAAIVRQQVVVALHRLWTPEAQAAVVRSLHDRDETVRFIAVQSLGVHRTRPARDMLRTALRDTNVWVRAEAARALGRLGDDAVVDDLVGLLKRQDGPDHQAARESLQTLTGMDYVVVE